MATSDLKPNWSERAETLRLCEGECFYAGVKRLDLALSIDDRFRLPDQLTAAIDCFQVGPGRRWWDLQALSSLWHVCLAAGIPVIVPTAKRLHFPSY